MLFVVHNGVAVSGELVIAGEKSVRLESPSWHRQSVLFKNE